MALHTYSQPHFCLQSVTLVPQPPETPQDMSPLEQWNCLDGLPEPATDGAESRETHRVGVLYPCLTQGNVSTVGLGGREVI